MHGDRGVAPAAPHRQAYRRPGWSFGGDRQPDSAAIGPQQARSAGAAEPIRRYERENPGELIHIDIKKLGKFNRIGHRITGDRTGQSNLRARGKGPGWEYVHVCIDDASRIAFSQVMRNERKGCAVAFLKAAVAYYASLGVTVERVMTDNGSCYKSFAFRKACKRLGLKHIRTKPTRRRPTARPSASFKPACVSGPTLARTTPQKNGRPTFQPGFTATIGIVLMAVSTQGHLSAGSDWPGTTS
jgi:hypothetical protein